MMSCRPFLVIGLLLVKGGFSVQAERVVAFAGGEVILPCSVTNTARDHPPDFEWSKEGLVPHDVIFLYRDGCETFEMKHPDFEFRASPFMRELKNGNISLRIFDVKLSDAGKYRCLILTGEAPQAQIIMELVVVAASEPKLSVVPADDGAVTLQCEARCCLPEAQMKILDEPGNNITAKETRGKRDDGGCYTVRQAVTLTSPTSRVICTVHQHEFKQSRIAEMFIPADSMKPNLSYIAVSVGGTVLFCFVAFVIFWTQRDCKRSRCAQRPQPVMRENITLLHPAERSVMADNTGNSEIQKLREELLGLKEELRKKDKKIQEFEDRSQHHHVVCQHNQPTTAQKGSDKSPPDTMKSPSQSVDLDTETSNSTGDQNPEPAAYQGQNSNPALLRIRQRRNNSTSTLSESGPDNEDASTRSSSESCS